LTEAKTYKNPDSQAFWAFLKSPLAAQVWKNQRQSDLQCQSFVLLYSNRQNKREHGTSPIFSGASNSLVQPTKTDQSSISYRFSH
jgi:hypothetical protein